MRKSKSERKIFVKTIKGNKVAYKIRKPRNNTCGKCKVNLSGIPRDNVAKLKNYSKKRVNRKYGGNLCSKCSREAIIKGARQWKSDKS